jgi:hypothetical protein
MHSEATWHDEDFEKLLLRLKTDCTRHEQGWGTTSRPRPIEFDAVQ